MARARQREPIPDELGSIEAAADFWDSHDLADYHDQTREVDAQVDLAARTYLTALEPDLARRVAAYARRHGVSTQTLVNVWVTEKLGAASAGE